MADPGLSFAFVNFSYLPLIAFAVLTSKITSQINSLYGSLFIKEEKVKIFLISSKVMWISNSYSVAKHISRFISKAAFSNYKLWESLGFLTAFITSATGVNIHHYTSVHAEPIIKYLA